MCNKMIKGFKHWVMYWYYFIHIKLDKKGILNGGLGRGELGCVIGSTGAGKSHYLVQMGVGALRSKIDVVHYTFELSETQVGQRYDSMGC